MLFINSYMSKLYNQKIPIGIIPKPIEVALPRADTRSKAKFGQGISSTEDFFKKFNMIMDVIFAKVKSIHTLTSEWLDETRNLETVEKNTMYFKIWSFLVETENWRSINQLKLISARFYKDIKVNIQNTFGKIFKFYMGRPASKRASILHNQV